MPVSADAVKALREKTGAGIIDCKNALEQTNGDINKAEQLLKEKGLASAAKRAERKTLVGIIEPYIHAGGRIGAMVEINCETDFVARTEEFKNLAHDIAMQVAALKPQFLQEEDVPADFTGDKESAVLLKQPFIKDQSKTIKDLVTALIAKTGENIKVRRFSRFELGD